MSARRTSWVALIGVALALGAAAPASAATIAEPNDTIAEEGGSDVLGRPRARVIRMIADDWLEVRE